MAAAAAAGVVVVVAETNEGADDHDEHAVWQRW